MSSVFDLKAWMQPHLARVEVALAEGIAQPSPADLGEAMRYAVLDGGKRLRPLLVLATTEAVGGDMAAALRAACAIELIHAYSLVHDDMPCMDNDVLRRASPRCMCSLARPRLCWLGMLCKPWRLNCSRRWAAA